MGLSFRGLCWSSIGVTQSREGTWNVMWIFEAFQAIWASLAKAVQASVLKPCVGIAVSSK